MSDETGDNERNNATDARGGYGNYSTPDTRGSWEGAGGTSQFTNDSLSDFNSNSFDNPQGSFQLKDAFNQANPNFVGPISQFAPLTKSLNQLYAGYTPGGSDLGPGAAPAANAGAIGQSQTINDNVNTYGVANPSWLQRMGVIPGMSQENFLNRETAPQRDERIGNIATGIDAVGRTLIGGMMPAGFRMGLAGLGAYNNYQKTGDIKQAAGSALGAMPGYFGAAGQAIQGNYGNALGSVAQLNGMPGLDARALGMGLDATMGKDVRGQALGLAGMYTGSRLGGPVGGVFGNQLGRTISQIKGYK